MIRDIIFIYNYMDINLTFETSTTSVGISLKRSWFCGEIRVRKAFSLEKPWGDRFCFYGLCYLFIVYK